jgi:hypothetical protein
MASPNAPAPIRIPVVTRRRVVYRVLGTVSDPDDAPSINALAICWSDKDLPPGGTYGHEKT